MSKNIKHISRCYSEGRRYCILRGGARSGKTWAALYFLLFGAMSKEYDVASVVSVSVPHLRRGALRDFMQILSINGLEPYFRHYRQTNTFVHRNGAVLEFFSADESDKMRGAQRDWLFVNEVNLLEEEDFNQLNIRTKSFVIVDFNPSARFWLYELLEKIREPINKIECVSTYKDNPHLAHTQVQAIEQYRAIPEWWRVYGEGKWGETQGRAWYNWDITDKIPETFDVVAIDFGEGRAPSAIIGVYAGTDTVIAHELMYANTDILTIVNMLKDVKFTRMVGDPAQIDMINLLRKQNVNIYPARKMALTASFQLLNSKRLLITATSKNLLNEARSVEWSDKSRGIIKATADHAVDAVRYAIHTLYI